jgi:carbon-monoxide dehydrogenase medium subunit
LDILANNLGTAKILAGGTDLIVQMRNGMWTPTLVVDIKQIAELNILGRTRDHFEIGAAVSCKTINEHPEIPGLYPALTDATALIGGIQIQGRASLGGNLCNASPSADSIPALMVLDARAVIAGPKGHREVLVAEFCTGPGANALADDEVLTHLALPSPKPRTGARFMRFTPRNEMDIAVASAAASVTLSETGSHFVDALIALGAVGPKPILARDAGAGLAGMPVNGEAIVTAAALARSAAVPIDDLRGTAGQRRHLVGVLAARALRGAVERARSAAL